MFMCRNIYGILSGLSALVLFSGIQGCSAWTEPEHLDFTSDVKEMPEEYYKNLRDFKKTDHKIVIVGMDATSEYPSSKGQHFTSMPDSADYICVRISDSIHPVIAAEIQQVKEQKGTSFLCDIAYMKIEEAWSEIQNSKPEPDSKEEYRTFVKEETQKQLAMVSRYGFDGIMISYIADFSSQWAATGADEFLKTLEEWKNANSGLMMAARGYLTSRVPEDSFLYGKDCRFHILTVAESTVISIDLKIKNEISYGLPDDRIMVETFEYPTDERDEIKCPTPQQAAEWAVSRSDSMTKLGFYASDAQLDYKSTGYFSNIRKAISIMNAEPSAE